MIIKVLTSEQFDKYVYENNYNSIYQTSEYTEVMKKHGYDTLLLGLIDDDKVIGIITQTDILRLISKLEA